MTELLTNNIESNTEKNKSYKKYLVGAVAVFAVWFACHESQKNQPDEQNLESNTPYTNEQNQKCTTTWEMPGIDHSNGDWVGGGIPEIKNGSNRVAREVFNDWFDTIDNDSELLSYLLTTIHTSSDNIDHNAIDKNTLVNSEGCASVTASKEVNGLKEQMESATFTFEDAPIDGQNSHIENDVVIKNADPKIEGNRKAVKITFENGNNLWILGICGNLVTKEATTAPIHRVKSDDNYVVVKKKVVIIESQKQENKTITKKSSNTNDYKEPGPGLEKDAGNGNKKVVTVSTPVESKPPKVEPNNDKPNSQTNTKTPESSPSPSTTNKQNEGDSNNGSISD